MPELPEVETVAAGLRTALVGDRISDVRTSGLSLRRPVDLRQLRRAAVGARIDRIDRYGKYLLFGLDSGYVLLAHLGMSGRFELVTSAPAPAHTHFRATLASRRELRFVDPRRFGVLVAYPAKQVAGSKELGELGPDPFGDRFTAPALAESLRATRRTIKEALLDQRVVAGVGNIYACEALFVAGVHPAVRGRRLSRARATALHAALLRVLRLGIENRGTSFRDYRDLGGAPGENQHALAVYGREGQPCHRCGADVRRIVQGARSTFFCAGCQQR